MAALIESSRIFMKRVVVIFFLSVLTTGCAQKSLYNWGSYESSLYGMYSETESYSIDRDISILTTEIRRTVQANQQVPPGKSAHVGYLYYLRGDKESARNFFEEEKSRFPESAVFIDGLLARMK
jgi:hypothetical protein